MVRKALCHNCTAQTQKLRFFARAELLPFSKYPTPIHVSRHGAAPIGYRKTQYLPLQRLDIGCMFAHEFILSTPHTFIVWIKSP